jgi:RNA polymerase sigma-70 factor (ECF subfamily)
MNEVHPLDDVSDATLLGAIAAGDRRALAKLYERHEELLRRTAANVLRDRSDAEDVVQDVFLAIVDRAHLYSPERGSARAWIVTMGRNLAIDRLRRQRWRAGIHRDTLPHATPGVVAPVDASALDGSRMRQALDSLPASQRATIEAILAEGLNFRELASRQQISVNTVKSRAARAVHALRAVLDPPKAA